MNSELATPAKSVTDGASDAPSARAVDRAGAARRIEPTASFWFAMFAASALGTNLGDFWSDALSLGLGAAFISMAGISAVAIAGDRWFPRRTEFFYWAAIVTLRAAATNIADFLTHERAISYALVAAIFGVATVGAAFVTSRGADEGSSTRIDGGYWATMFLAGIFGTVGGDLTTLTIGVESAAALLVVVLLAVLAVRTAFVPKWIFGYWFVIMAERAAGTPVGDSLQGDDGVGLGLPVSMACFAALLAAGVVVHTLLAKKTLGQASPAR